jgi:MinD superfamily P-loop ATPase
MIISIASGKGGTGKTLVATSLALSLKAKYRVQVLDCDVEEPNSHLFLKPSLTQSEPVNIMVPQVDETKCNYCGRCARVCAYNAIAVLSKNVLTFPQLCHGCGACSYLCPEQAISEVPFEIGVVESGPADEIEFVHGRLAIGQAMAPPIIKKVKRQVDGDSVVIVDASPGTSCPVVEAVRGSDFCLLVTEPTPFGLNDLALAVETMRQMAVPCGVIINRAGSGDELTEAFCREQEIPVLLKIPLNTAIARFYSRGITLVEGIPNWLYDFNELFDEIKDIIG